MPLPTESSVFIDAGQQTTDLELKPLLVRSSPVEWRHTFQCVHVIKHASWQAICLPDAHTDRYTRQCALSKLYCLARRLIIHGGTLTEAQSHRQSALTYWVLADVAFLEQTLYKQSKNIGQISLESNVSTVMLSLEVWSVSTLLERGLNDKIRKDVHV